MSDRSDARLIAQAARQAWPLGPDVQAQVTLRLAALVLDEESKPRVVTAAARALAALGNLALAQQRLDAAEDRPAAGGPLDLRAILESPGYKAFCEARDRICTTDEQRAARLERLREETRQEQERLLDQERREAEGLHAQLRRVAEGTGPPAATRPAGSSPPGNHPHEEP